MSLLYRETIDNPFLSSWCFWVEPKSNKKKLALSVGIEQKFSFLIALTKSIFHFEKTQLFSSKKSFFSKREHTFLHKYNLSIKDVIFLKEKSLFFTNTLIFHHKNVNLFHISATSIIKDFTFLHKEPSCYPEKEPSFTLKHHKRGEARYQQKETIERTLIEIVTKREDILKGSLE